jgi:nucleoid DNA-binding protein
LQVEIHKRFVNKASDWTIRKREANQIVWATGLVLPSFLQSNQRLCLQMFCEFQLAVYSRRVQIAQSNPPIKIAILWDNIAMLLASIGFSYLK